jgi:hypothetical protein
MKKIFGIVIIFVSPAALNAFGQKVCKTNFSFDINSSTPTNSETYWETPPPDNLILNAAKSWDRNQRNTSLRKNLGFNLQYSNIRYGRGILDEGYMFKGNNVSLSANTALLDHFCINGKLAFSAGSEVEILLIGNNNLEKPTHTPFTNPSSSGIIHERSLNRDYFNQPSYGIKPRLFESDITVRTSFGIAVSYLWTKAEYSNFYASNYTRISFGFGKKNIEVISDPLN